MVDGWKKNNTSLATLWVNAKVKQCFKFKNGKFFSGVLKDIPDEVCCYPVYGGNGIIGYSDKYLLEEPTIIIGRVGEYCGNVFLTREKSWVTDNAMLVSNILLKEYDIKFWTLMLNSLNFNHYNDSTGQPKITQGGIGAISFLYPVNKSEQTAIANILSKVDEAIASVQKSISAAERLKKSLMQNLLTGRMKPDGTFRKDDEFYVDEKFGKVPKGWEVKAIGDKSVCIINPSYKYKKKEVYDFVPMDAVRERFGGLDYIEKQIIDNGSYTRFKTGDILFAKITPCSENGKVAYIEHIESEIGFASTEFIVFHPTEQVDGRFVYMMLVSENVHRLAISLMEGTTGRQRIPWKIFQNRIFVAMPNKKEQAEIVQLLISFDKQIIDKQINITILDQLKKSLMQNLLTGKVRVNL